MSRGLEDARAEHNATTQTDAVQPTASHAWPSDPTEHVFGPWMTHTSTPTLRTQYRQCVHPTCTGFEIRPAVRA